MEINYPDLKTRVQSIFIDALLMVALMFVAAWILDKVSLSESDEGWVKALIFVGIWGIYEPLAMTFGCTLGNYLMKIRVRNHNNVGKRINLIQAYGRFFVKMLLGWISFLTMNFNKERRAIHDFISETVVIAK
jgi:uncharacterized RDD family membrane protein YckC